MRQRFIQSFSTSGDVQTAVDNNELGKPYVAYVEDGQYIDWNSKGIDYASIPLTFEIISGGTIVWKAGNTAYTTTIEYSKDNGETWTSITSNTWASAPSISVSAGDVIQFRGDNATYSSGTSRYNTFSGSTAQFEVEGNIMSMMDSTGYATATTLTSSYTFYYLFHDCTGLTSAENLILPATTLASSCYQGMFQGCTSLTTAPELPATRLVEYCYNSMFTNCTSLTTAPELPATILANGCYQSMFWGCTSLTTPPALPAETLTQSCYQFMFNGCTSLNYVKCLATNPVSKYTTNWLSGVAASGTFVKHPDATWSSGTSGIPTGWTVIDAEV